MPWHRYGHNGDGFHGRPGSEMRLMRRAPLSEPYPGDPLSGQERERGARPDDRGGARVLGEIRRDCPADRTAFRRWTRLSATWADDLDAFRRRGPAAQARALSARRPRTTRDREQRQEPAADVSAGRADHRARVGGYTAAVARARPAGGGGQYAGGGRAQPRVHRARRLYHRPWSGRRRRRRTRSDGGRSTPGRDPRKHANPEGVAAPIRPAGGGGRAHDQVRIAQRSRNVN